MTIQRSPTEILSVLDTAHEAFVAMDSGGFITEWNPGAEATFGWAREEAIGRVLSDTIIPERFRDAHLGGLSRYLETGEGPVLGARLELSGLRRDGREFPLEITIAVGPGTPPVFHAFLRDISERKRREGYMQAQHATTAVLAEAETIHEAAPGLLQAIGEGMGWELGAWWEPAHGGVLACAATWLVDDAGLKEFAAATRSAQFESGRGLPGRVLASRSPAFIQDLSADRNFPRARLAAQAGLTAAVAVPVLAGEKVRGVIEFFTRAPRYPEPELIEMMETLTAQIARFATILADREKLLERLERLALTDELTGLPNRRAWDQGLRREIARAERENEPICVAMIDIDHFKRFNDERGHPAGDAVLREAAQAWAARLRATDLLARYGGEEFALAFPAWPLDSAELVVERLRAATPSGLTCSAGLAAWTRGESLEELVQRVDAALYAAKDAGRDRTVIAAA